jgi:hypothetical protein
MLVTSHNGNNSIFLLNYATQVLCFILVTPFVFLRFLVRWKLSGTLGIDDGMHLVNLFKHASANLFSLLFHWMGKKTADLRANAWMVTNRRLGLVHGVLLKCFALYVSCSVPSLSVVSSC